MIANKKTREKREGEREGERQGEREKERERRERGVREKDGQCSKTSPPPMQSVQ